jgi:hypothetical protein
MRKTQEPRAHKAHDPKSARNTKAIRKRRLPYHHAAAFREAGHAVAAWQRGVMLMPLSIFMGSKQAGRNVWNDPLRNVDFEWVRSAKSPALARRLASILIAGPVAETLFGPKLPRGTVSLERLRDARTLLRAASRNTDGARGTFAKARAETASFLERPRVKRAVTALAAALFDRGTLQGGRAAAIIESHLDV